MNSINILFNESEIQFPIDNRIPDKKDGIYYSLFNNHKYCVKSKVRTETFQTFLNYWRYDTFPYINSDNIFEYLHLSHEFGFLENYFDSPKSEILSDILMLINPKKRCNNKLF